MIWVVGMTFMLLLSVARAHDVEKTRSIEEAISEILVQQGISTVSQIDCTKVSGAQFEELGDSIMDKVVGNHELHEQMDAMMGGEGSASLVQMHAIMGKNWLGCGQGARGFGGMMGINMMPMMMRMMGNYYPAYFSSYNTILILAIAGWIVFTVLLVILLLVFTGTIKVKKKSR